MFDIAKYCNIMRFSVPFYEFRLIISKIIFLQGFVRLGCNTGKIIYSSCNISKVYYILTKEQCLKRYHRLGLIHSIAAT